MKRLFFACIIYLSHFSANCQSFPSYLIAYFPFDSNVQDSTANSNDGIPSNVSYTQNRIGIAGKALSLNGTDSYIDLGSNSALSFSTGSFSFSVWFKTSAIDQVILDNYSWSGPAESTKKGFVFSVEGKKPRFNILTGVGSNGNLPPTSYFIDGSNDVNDNTWHHFVAVYNDIEDTMRIYIDGQQVGRRFCDASPSVSTSNLNIGRRPSYNNLHFDGAIDELAMYSIALLPTDIFNLYNGANVSVHKMEGETDKVLIYPNPIKRNQILHVNSQIGIKDIELFDIYGKLTHVSVSGDYSSLSITDLLPGSYTLFIELNDGLIEKRLLLIAPN